MLPTWLLCVLPLFAIAEGGGSPQRVAISPAPPRFVHPAHNVTVLEGLEVTLLCSVTSLHGYQLAWVHEETQTILSIGRQLYTRSPRLSLNADHHSAGLTISPVLAIDRGWYMCQLNTQPMTSSRSYLQVLVPPTLEDWSGSYVEVREGVTVRLTCRARAFPPALTTWRREDSEPIFRSPTVWVMEGAELLFQSVRREHTGAYVCRVDNNATAPVTRTTHLTVTYAPVLWLGQELVGTKAGLDVTLNCSSEANPPAQHFWSVNSTNITNSDKYHLQEIKLSTRTEVLLTVNDVGQGDFTHYRCHAINPTGHAEGTIRLYEIKERVVVVPTRPAWHIPPLGQLPPSRHTTKSTLPPTTLWPSRGDPGRSHLEDSLRKTKLATNKIPSPSGSWKLLGKSNDKYLSKINYQHRSRLHNTSSLMVDMIEGGGAGCMAVPSVGILLLTLAIIHLHQKGTNCLG